MEGRDRSFKRNFLKNDAYSPYPINQKPNFDIQACLPGKDPNRYLQGQKSGFAMKNRYKSFKA